MSELKPCPFCGEQVFPPLTSSFDDGYTRCGFCGAKMQHRRWQSRPIEDELQKRIVELEAAQNKAFDLVRKLRMYCFNANWDYSDPEEADEFNEFDAEVCEYLSEYKVCIDQLTAHSDIKRQDDKSSNDTQTQTIVYVKEDSEVQE